MIITSLLVSLFCASSLSVDGAANVKPVDPLPPGVFQEITPDPYSIHRTFHAWLKGKSAAEVESALVGVDRSTMRKDILSDIESFLANAKSLEAGRKSFPPAEVVFPVPKVLPPHAYGPQTMGKARVPSPALRALLDKRCDVPSAEMDTWLLAFKMHADNPRVSEPAMRKVFAFHLVDMLNQRSPGRIPHGLTEAIVEGMLSEPHRFISVVDSPFKGIGRR